MIHSGFLSTSWILMTESICYLSCVILIIHNDKESTLWISSNASIIMNNYDSEVHFYSIIALEQMTIQCYKYLLYLDYTIMLM